VLAGYELLDVAGRSDENVFAEDEPAPPLPALDPATLIELPIVEVEQPSPPCFLLCLVDACRDILYLLEETTDLQAAVSCQCQSRALLFENGFESGGTEPALALLQLAAVPAQICKYWRRLAEMDEDCQLIPEEKEAGLSRRQASFDLDELIIGCARVRELMTCWIVYPLEQ
jgi:hypothetical protein